MPRTTYTALGPRRGPSLTTPRGRAGLSLRAGPRQVSKEQRELERRILQEQLAGLVAEREMIPRRFGLRERETEARIQDFFNQEAMRERSFKFRTKTEFPFTQETARGVSTQAEKTLAETIRRNKAMEAIERERIGAFDPAKEKAQLELASIRRELGMKPDPRLGDTTVPPQEAEIAELTGGLDLEAMRRVMFAASQPGGNASNFIGVLARELGTRDPQTLKAVALALIQQERENLGGQYETGELAPGFKGFPMQDVLSRAKWYRQVMETGELSPDQSAAALNRKVRRYFQGERPGGAQRG